MWVGLLIFYVANVANEASVFLSSMPPLFFLSPLMPVNKPFIFMAPFKPIKSPLKDYIYFLR